MTIETIVTERPHWQSREVGPLSVHSTGNRADIDEIAAALANGAGGIDELSGLLKTVPGHFAAIIEGPDFCCAFTDHCRTVPVFYTGTAVANDAHALRNHCGLDTPDPAAVRDAAMAGFVISGRTVYSGLHQLRAGTCAWWSGDAAEPDTRQYRVYLPDNYDSRPEAALADDLLAIVDHAIDQTIAQANGRSIWVPLSAGLDSRLLLAKLVERGYDNLFAFTYGPGGNDEARAARHVAEKLAVPWRFVPSRRTDMRTFFASNARRDYWTFSDGLSSVPNFQDLLALRQMDAQGTLPADAVLVNGQTGDFISGGHIPASLMTANPGVDGLFDAIVAKHFSLWNSLKVPETLADLRERVLTMLGVNPDEAIDRDAAIAHYERFELEERQAKYVINGQRNYEFLGRDWSLPLWDSGIVEFWRNVPVEQKYRQKLYRSALARWDYHGLFKDYQPVVWQWPGAMKAVLVPSRLIRLTLGVPARDAFLKRMLYFGMYSDQYAPFGYRHYLRNAEDLRNPVSLLSRQWLSDLGLRAS